jgi:hypothetical protein
MYQENRRPVLVLAALAMLIGMALGACSAGSYSAASVQTPDSATRPSATGDSGSAIPEIVVTASRLTSPRVAEQSSPLPPAKRRG